MVAERARAREREREKEKEVVKTEREVVTRQSELSLCEKSHNFTRYKPQRVSLACECERERAKQECFRMEEEKRKRGGVRMRT